MEQACARLEMHQFWESIGRMFASVQPAGIGIAGFLRSLGDALDIGTLELTVGEGCATVLAGHQVIRLEGQLAGNLDEFTAALKAAEINCVVCHRAQSASNAHVNASSTETQRDSKK